MLAHTQFQISILVGLDEYSRTASKDAGLASSGDMPHKLHGLPNTDEMEEARNLINNDTGFSQS